MIKKVSQYFFVIALLASCHKVGKTTATILVRDEAKNPVSGVQVKLFANSTDDKMKIDIAYSNINLVSGSDGKVSYDFSKLYKLGQAGVAVFDIYALKIVNGDSLVGTSHIVLESEKSNEASVTIQKQ